MNASIGGIVVVTSAKVLATVAEGGLIYLVPNKLRLIRTTLGDNGFRGIRTVTSNVQFLKDLQKEADLNKETGDYLPADITQGSPASPNTDAPGAAFASIEEGEFMTVSPGHSLKYLVCNPNHRWALTVRNGVIHLYPCAKATANKSFKLTQVVEVNGMASFI